MLNKKICPNCRKKMKGSPNFCPNCGFPIKNVENEWGILGKEDSVEQEIPKIFSGIGNGMMNRLIGSAMKILEKEMKKDMRTMPKTKIKLMINGREMNPNLVGVSNEKDSSIKILPVDFSKENLDRWRKLKKLNPKSKIKRVENKIKYELEVPEVKSIKDVSIVKLENSLEIRAVGKKEAYFKIIPINLPLRKYSLVEGLLTLEMDAK